jgi:hypothetical protein
MLKKNEARHQVAERTLGLGGIKVKQSLGMISAGNMGRAFRASTSTARK